MKKDQKKQGALPPLIPPQWGIVEVILRSVLCDERISQYQSLSFSLKTFFYPENTGIIFYWATHIEQLTRISFQVFTFILTFSHQGRRNYSDASS
jgi:hypothetical protein